LWNPNQTGLVDYVNQHHYKTLEKHTIKRTRSWWRSFAL